MHMSIRTRNLGSTVSTKNVSRLHRLLLRTVLINTSSSHSWQLEDSAHGILTILSASFGAVLHVLHAKSSGACPFAPLLQSYLGYAGAATPLLLFRRIDSRLSPCLHLQTPCCNPS